MQGFFYVENWSDVFFLCTSRTRHELYLMSTTHSCAKPATLARFCIHIAKLAVITRGEALNPRTVVVCSGFEHCSIQESGRRGFAVRLAAKYVDECLDLVQIQTAKPVVYAVDGRRVRICTTVNTHCAQAIVVRNLRGALSVFQVRLFFCVCGDHNQ